MESNYTALCVVQQQEEYSVCCIRVFGVVSVYGHYCEDFIYQQSALNATLYYGLCVTIFVISHVSNKSRHIYIGLPMSEFNFTIWWK